jgi:ABC-type transporter lipoprotein component MlaA
LVFVFSFGAWWEIRSIQKAARATQRGNAHADQNQLTANAKKKDPLNKFKRRVLNIAIQTSACLLLNMVR